MSEMMSKGKVQHVVRPCPKLLVRKSIMAVKNARNASGILVLNLSQPLKRRLLE